MFRNKHKFLFDKINQPDFKKKVVNYVTSFWGPGYNFNIVLADKPRARIHDPKAMGEKVEARSATGHARSSGGASAGAIDAKCI